MVLSSKKLTPNPPKQTEGHEHMMPVKAQSVQGTKDQVVVAEGDIDAEAEGSEDSRTELRENTW